MQSVSTNIINHYASVFAGDKMGFSLKEIYSYFLKYSYAVKAPGQYSFNPSRQQLFINSVKNLSPKEQYYSLTDLCINTVVMKYKIPPPEICHNLMSLLHMGLNFNPIGLKFSKLREHIYRKQWYTAVNEIKENPGSAISMARTLLETIFKTIITERDDIPDNSGDISVLLKQTEGILGFNKKENQEEHRIFLGLANIINGIAGLSNKSGIRHGTIFGIEIDNPSVAELVVNASGTVGIMFIELHLFKPLKSLML